MTGGRTVAMTAAAAALGRLPLVAAVNRSTRRSVLDDVVAGVLVTAVAVPLSIGFAGVAGVPPVAGLYSCLLPLVAFALLGSSRHLKLGFDAASSAMVAAALAPLAVTVGADSGRYLALVSLLTLLVGGIVLLAGLLRVGVVAELVSLPVLVGYQTGIALSVVVGQVPKLLGYTADGDNDLSLAADVVRRVGELSATTVAVGGACLLAARLLRRTRPAWPAGLLALSGATAASVLLDLEQRGVAVVGELPSGLPALGLPAVGWSDVVALLGPAAAIALVTSADVVVTSRNFAARLRYDVRPNQDLVGLGAADLVSGVSGGLPTSASYARTALAERARSTTQLSSVAAAGAMVVVLLLLTDVIALVPRAALAAVVVDAVLNLVDVDGFRRLGRTRRSELLVAVFTTVGVLTVGLLTTLAAAVGWSLLLFVRRLVRAEDDTRAPSGTAAMVFRWDAPLFFANAGAFRVRLLNRLSEAEGDGVVVRHVVVDGSAISELDHSGVAELERLADELAVRQVLLHVAEPPGAERALLEATGFPRLFDDVETALAACRDGSPQP